MKKDKFCNLFMEGVKNFFADMFKKTGFGWHPVCNRRWKSRVFYNAQTITFLSNNRKGLQKSPQVVGVYFLTFPFFASFAKYLIQRVL